MGRREERKREREGGEGKIFKDIEISIIKKWNRQRGEEREIRLDKQIDRKMQ